MEGATIDGVMHALNDSSRRRILTLLRQAPHCVGDLVDEIGLTQPGVSKHLRILEAAGLVQGTKHGQRRIYRLEPHGFQALDAWLEDYRAFWTETLDHLAQMMEKHHGE